MSGYFLFSGIDRGVKSWYGQLSFTIEYYLHIRSWRFASLTQEVDMDHRLRDFLIGSVGVPGGLIFLAMLFGFGPDGGKNGSTGVPTHAEVAIDDELVEPEFPENEDDGEPAKPVVNIPTEGGSNDNPRHRMPAWAGECARNFEGAGRYVPTICGRGGRLVVIEPPKLLRKSAIGTSWEREAKRGWDGPPKGGTYSHSKKQRPRRTPSPRQDHKTVGEPGV